jgi:hypothetical protein
MCQLFRDISHDERKPVHWKVLVNGCSLYLETSIMESINEWKGNIGRLGAINMDTVNRLYYFALQVLMKAVYGFCRP